MKRLLLSAAVVALHLQVSAQQYIIVINVWYGTLMPQGSMKCSYPLIGDDRGIYLNRRGLKDGPDKYGKQVRGVKVVADSKAEGDDPFNMNHEYQIVQLTGAHITKSFASPRYASRPSMNN